MSTVSEKPSGLREMNFAGSEVDYLLENDVKLITIRIPDAKYDFGRGEVIAANCSDSGKKVRLVVIDNFKSPLAELLETELLLDGYDSAEAAAENLRWFGGKYGGITETTELQVIMTMTEEKWLSLSEATRAETLARGGREMLNDVDRPMGSLFYPAWCRWQISKGAGVSEWWWWLQDQDLAYCYEMSRVEERLGTELISDLRRGGQDALWEIWEAKETDLYRTVILLEGGGKLYKQIDFENLKM